MLAMLAALSTVACSGGSDDGSSEKDADPDSDGDGLTDAEEEELGLDPDSADSDMDGASDFDEINKGLDPLNADSDGDGYLDGDELTEGKDPLDAASVIYQGGWPYAASKAELDEADVPANAERGELFVHFQAKDQFGDTVDLWDFKNDEDKFIIVDISAQWCGPCNQMSSWLDGHEPSFDAAWPGLVDAINNGDVYWVTVLGQDYFGDPARQDTVAEWYAEYPNPNIAILADNDYTTVDFVQLSYWPTVLVLNGKMNVAFQAGPRGSWADGVDFAYNKVFNSDTE